MQRQQFFYAIPSLAWAALWLALCIFVFASYNVPPRSLLCLVACIIMAGIAAIVGYWITQGLVRNWRPNTVEALLLAVVLFSAPLFFGLALAYLETPSQQQVASGSVANAASSSTSTPASPATSPPRVTTLGRRYPRPSQTPQTSGNLPDLMWREQEEEILKAATPYIPRIQPLEKKNGRPKLRILFHGVQPETPVTVGKIVTDVPNVEWIPKKYWYYQQTSYVTVTWVDPTTGLPANMNDVFHVQFGRLMREIKGDHSWDRDTLTLDNPVLRVAHYEKFYSIDSEGDESVAPRPLILMITITNAPQGSKLHYNPAELHFVVNHE